jgi:hypothetical protein
VDDCEFGYVTELKKTKNQPRANAFKLGKQIFFTMKQQAQDWVERKSTGRK